MLVSGKVIQSQSVYGKPSPYPSTFGELSLASLDSSLLYCSHVWCITVSSAPDSGFCLLYPTRPHGLFGFHFSVHGWEIYPHRAKLKVGLPLCISIFLRIKFLHWLLLNAVIQLIYLYLSMCTYIYTFVLIFSPFTMEGLSVVWEINEKYVLLDTVLKHFFVFIKC